MANRRARRSGGGARLKPAEALALAARKFVAGDLAAVEEICATVLQAEPGNADAWNTLGIVMHRTGRLAEAENALSKALALAPKNPACLLNLGILLVDLGRHDAAIALLTQACEVAPHMATMHNNLGLALLNSQRLEAAAERFDRALALDPANVAAALNLGFANARLGRIREAESAYGKALGTRKNDTARVKLATLLPVIPQSTDEIAGCRARMQSAVEELSRAPLALEEPVRDGTMAFYLAFHGQDDKPLQTALSRMYLHGCRALDFCAPHCRDWKRPERPLKVGFISAFMRDHSVGHVTRGLVAKLSREHFSTYALFIPPMARDGISSFIAANARHVVVLPAALEAARRAIAALELDVLFYQDIGMEPVSYFLAHARLAPVQCVSFGHPDTTGIPNVDYFVSNDLFEPPGAAAHYSEKLFLLHDLGTLAYYYRPEAAPRQPTRAELGLPEGARIYYCPQTPYKFHPDFDAMLDGILHADPEGIVALPQATCREWDALLLRRMERTLAERMSRVVTIPQRGGAGFLSLLGAADVLLDTTHFNGMNTSLLGFAAGTPIVTLPGAFQRGRHTAGMYRKMEISECIAGSPQEYVDTAVRVARDRDYREAIRDSIVSRRDVLFEDDAVVREFERFFLEAAAAAGT